MENFRYITQESVPCWYELVWREETKGIILRIHTDFTNGVKPILKNSPIVQRFKQEFGFKQAPFALGADNIGFEKSLVFTGEYDGFLEYSVPTSLIRKPTGKKCGPCKGKGHDKLLDRACLYCDGVGKEIVTDYTEAYAVSATLSTLFLFLQFPEVETKCSFPQLMTIEMCTLAGPHGGSLHGELSMDLANWLRTLPQPSEMIQIVSVMRIVYEAMCGEMKDFYRHSFREWLPNNGRLLINCPGDACGLHPDMGHEGSTEGYKFNCHNTDTMLQQMTLLSALAGLNTIARKAL